MKEDVLTSQPDRAWEEPQVERPAGQPDSASPVAVEARRAADAGRLASALANLVEEDPSLAVRNDPETGQILLSGLGELHLEVAVEKMRRAGGPEVITGRPEVTYRETVVRGVSGLVYRHVKQDGGAGQFAHVVLDVEAEDEEGFVFRSAVVGGRVPREYIRAVEAGCRDALAEGVAAGDSTVRLAAKLFLSRQGIEYHVSILLRQFKVPNRTALVAKAYSIGMFGIGSWPPQVLPDYIRTVRPATAPRTSSTRASR